MKLKFFMSALSVSALSVFLSSGPATAEVSSIVLSDANLKKLESQEPFSQSTSVSDVEAAFERLVDANDTGNTQKSLNSGNEYYQIFEGLDVEMFRLTEKGGTVEKSWDQLTSDEKDRIFDDGKTYTGYQEANMGAQLGLKAAGATVKKGDYIVKTLKASTGDMPCFDDQGHILGKFLIGSGVLIDINLNVVRGKVGLTFNDISRTFGAFFQKVNGSVDVRSIGLRDMPELSRMAANASGDLSKETIKEAINIAALPVSWGDISQPKVLMSVDYKAPGVVRQHYLEGTCNLPKPEK